MSGIDKAAIAWSIAIVALGVGFAGFGGTMTPESTVNDSASVREGSGALQQSYNLGNTQSPTISAPDIADPKLNPSLKVSPQESQKETLSVKEPSPSKFNAEISANLQTIFHRQMNSLIEHQPLTPYETNKFVKIFENTGKDVIFVGIEFSKAKGGGEIMFGEIPIYGIESNENSYTVYYLKPGEVLGVQATEGTVSGYYEWVTFTPPKEFLVTGFAIAAPEPIYMNNDPDPADWTIRISTPNTLSGDYLIHICESGILDKNCKTQNFGQKFDKELSLTMPMCGKIFHQIVSPSDMKDKSSTGVGGMDVSKDSIDILFSERSAVSFATKG